MYEIELFLLILLLLLLMYEMNANKEYFGVDDRPFEPDGSMPMRNPWDDIDYITPKYYTY